MSNKAWVIGSGLSAATCVHELRQFGIHSSVFEKDARWGGLVRSDRLNGVIYEPHGSHLFHTDDAEVWELVNSLIAFNDYEHRVQTMVRGELLTWPIQEDEVVRVYGKKVAAKLKQTHPGKTPLPTQNFEDWCSTIMPREVYEDFVRPYTEKQWGKPAKELAADFAPKRVQVRTDGDDRLFKDRYQGFPDGTLDLSYEDLLVALYGQSTIDLHLFPELHMTLESTIEMLKRHPPSWRPRFVIVTVPLDDFASFELGELEWRGLTFSHKHIADVDLVQPRMVLNWPGKEYAWIRTHETKHASRQRVKGSVISTEFTGGPGRYYPVPGAKGKFRNRNELYKTLIRNRLTALGVETLFVGRLANFLYLDMDDVIRQALNTIRSAVATTQEAA